MKLWKEVPSRALSWFKGAVPSIEVNPALLGVGYIIGTRISCVMCGGGVLAWLVFAPAIHFFGDSLDKPLYPSKAKYQRDEPERYSRCLHAVYRNRRRRGRWHIQLVSSVAADPRVDFGKRQGFA